MRDYSRQTCFSEWQFRRASRRVFANLPAPIVKVYVLSRGDILAKCRCPLEFAVDENLTQLQSEGVLSRPTLCFLSGDTNHNNADCLCAAS